MALIPPENLGTVITAGVALLVGLLSAGAALLGSHLQATKNLQAQRQAIESANRRASADYLLQKEADALMELLEKAEQCHALTQQFVNAASANQTVSDDLAEETNTALAEFESAARTHTVFLEDVERQAVRDFLSTIQKSTAGARHHLSGQPGVAQELIDWMELMNGFDELSDELRPVIRSRIQELRTDSETVN